MPDTAPQPLIIIGAGGHAREMIWIAQSCPDRWDLLGCLDDRDELQGQEVSGIPVLGRIDQWQRWTEAFLIVALGSPRTRQAIVGRLESSGRPRYATLVHPSVLLSSHVTLGQGSMVSPGCILTTQIKVGRHVLLNLNCSVSHDCTLDDFATVAPGVAVPGNVHMEAGSELAIGAVLRQGLRIGRGAFVGMGAVATRDVSDGSLVIGCPARPHRQLEPF
jgi:sugar O-acyltransferase (sialic acid O-acetyltransferase NeuD family)